jgi:tetratricopeptide (TPR) repeat protein
MSAVRISIASFIFAVLIGASFGVRGTSYGEMLASALREFPLLLPAAIFLSPNDASLYFEKGNYHFGNGSYDIGKAQNAYQKALAIDVKLPRAHYQMARIYFLRAKFQSAITEINSEIALDPDYKKSYYMKGLIQGYAGDLDDSIANFKRFIELDSFNWAGYNDLAWIYFKKGDYTHAKEAAVQGLVHAPENPWLNNALGLAAMNLGEKERAKESFERALRSLDQMVPEDWGNSYPGNDPRIYEKGLEEMRTSIRSNLSLLD